MPTLPLLEADAAVEGTGGIPIDLSRSTSASSSGRADGKLPESLILEVGAGRRVGLLGTCTLGGVNVGWRTIDPPS